MRISPAEYVIQVFNGVRKTARAIGWDHSNICKWRKTGQIPKDAMRPLLERAQADGLDLTAEDLILGRRIEAADGKR